MPVIKPRLIARLVKNRDGAAAVEFALVMVPLIGIILASLQTAIIFTYDQALQSVGEKSARQLMTGAAQNASLTQSQFQTAVCGYASPVFNCSNIMIDVESASSFSAINTAALTPTYNGSGTVTNTWSYSPGNAGDIVIMRLMYNWPVIGGPLAPGLANQSNGSRLLVATSVFKNEPYN